MAAALATVRRRSDGPSASPGWLYGSHSVEPTVALAANLTDGPICRSPHGPGAAYGDDPTAREALDEPLVAFPSWFMRITCDRCGKDRMLNGVQLRSDSAPCRSARSSPACATTAAGAGGVAHRHRGRQQPAGATDRAARRLTSGRPSSFDRPTWKVEPSKRVHLDACSGVIANRKGRWVRFRRKMSPSWPRFRSAPRLHPDRRPSGADEIGKGGSGSSRSGT